MTIVRSNTVNTDLHAVVRVRMLSMVVENALKLLLAATGVPIVDNCSIKNEQEFSQNARSGKDY